MLIRKRVSRQVNTSSPGNKDGPRPIAAVPFASQEPYPGSPDRIDSIRGKGLRSPGHPPKGFNLRQNKADEGCWRIGTGRAE